MPDPVPPAPGPDPVPSCGFLYTCRFAPDGTYTFDAPPADVESLYEIGPDEMSRMLTAGHLPFLPDAGPDLWASIRASAENLTPWVGDAHVRGYRTGRQRWVRLHGVPRREPDGAVVWSGLITDITDLKAAAAELRDVVGRLARSEAWVRTALDGAEMLGWDLDLVADRWETTADIPAFYGVPRGPDYTRIDVALTVVHPDDVPAVLAGRQRAIDTGEPVRYEFRGRHPSPDGRPRWFSTRGRVLRDEAGRAARVVAVTTEITELKRAEGEREAMNARLLDAQKWESLGVLAGGVAHDFNNILTIVLGNAGLARKALPQTSPAGPLLDQIDHACQRAAGLCRQLLAYSGRGPAAAGPADLNQLVRASAALLEVPASRQAELRFELTAGLPPVRADPGQVRQVLMNLVMNAAEAVGEAAGEVRVVTGAVDIPADPPPGYHLPPAPGRYVRMAVSDTGPGVPPDVRARMFDPFFTTKFAGRGLGLAAVLGIARTHKGAIRVDTEPGRGTTVEVLWPAAGGRPAAAVPPPPPVPARDPDRAGLALVVDDEMFVREVTASTLEEIGYQPLLAGNAAAALELFRAHAGGIRVAVLDVVMPGMHGDELLDQLRALVPDLPAVLVSGYTDRKVSRPGTEFLQKPFHPEELMAAVRRVAAAAGP